MPFLPSLVSETNMAAFIGRRAAVLCLSPEQVEKGCRES